MEPEIQDLIRKAYSAFNSRDIDTALSTFDPEIEWPKAFEGGYVQGHEEIRDYWTRQWLEINPNVEPTQIQKRPNGDYEVTVHQTVKDLDGNDIFNGTVKHIYTIKHHLLRKMDIELD